MQTFYKIAFFVLLPVVLAFGYMSLNPSPQAVNAPSTTVQLDKKQLDTLTTELQAIRKSLTRLEQQGLDKAPAAKKTPATATLKMDRKRPFMGDEDAPVTVVEFTDYQCPFCRRFVNATLPLLKRDYIDKGKVRWEVRDLPLSFHKDARKAAQAALCAGEQDQFWKMRDSLFRNSANLGAEFISGYAEELALDMNLFEACTRSERFLDAIDTDAREANQLRITGTPTFVIGKSVNGTMTGTLVVGAQSPAVFASQIDKALAQ